MHDLSSRLVERDNGFILKQNRERQVFRLEVGRDRRGDFSVDFVSWLDSVTRTQDPPIDPHLASGNRALNTRPAHAQPLGQKRIEPRPGRCGRHLTPIRFNGGIHRQTHKLAPGSSLAIA